MTATLALALALGLPAQSKDNETPPKADAGVSKARANEMRDVALAVRMETNDGRTIEPQPEPIYRYDDPARRFSDGTVWAYGKTGRPSALLTLSLERSPAGNWQWLHELTKLSDGPVRAVAGGLAWAPTKPGIALTPVPSAPAPASDEAKRLRQLRELARRFKAHEFFKPSQNAREERYELRVLTQPVCRYADPKAGVIDGALFLISYGQNPEIVLLIEARDDGKGPPVWSYGLARISAARGVIRLDDREVAEFPEWPDNGPLTTYRIFGVPTKLSEN